METVVSNPLGVARSGPESSMLWSTKQPCVAEMFQVCSRNWSNTCGAGPDERAPLCYRSRSKGAGTKQAFQYGNELQSEAAIVAAAGKDTSDAEQNLLSKCDALGWDEFSWADTEASVEKVAAWLRSKGLKRGDRLCLFADAGPEWNVVFFACQYVGIAVCVREPRMEMKEAIMIINTVQPSMTIMDVAEGGALKDCMNKPEGLYGIAENFPWVAENGPSVQVFALEFEKLVADGGAALKEDNSLGTCDGQPDDIAVLCTTSGTTGVPKAAMHSQRALYHLGRYAEELMRTQYNLGGGSFGLSGERYCMPFDAGYISYIMVVVLGVSCGMEGCFLERPELRLRFRELKPAFMMMLADQCTELCHGAKATMAAKPLGVGTKLFNKAHNGRLEGAFVANTASIQEKAGGCFANIADGITAGKVRARLGGRVQCLGTGGAKVDDDVMRWFWGCGIPVYEMYASTEAMCISFNTPQAFKVGSPGIAPSHGPPHNDSPMCEIKIAEDGEIMLRGESVMKGYFNNSTVTEEVLEPLETGQTNRWFHTGDIGIGSACELTSDTIATKGQVPSAGSAAGTALKSGTVVSVSEIKGSRCKIDGKGWVDLENLEWKEERIGQGGATARFLKICGRKKRALVLDQPGMPWVWSESLEGILKHSALVNDLCVGFDGPAVWQGQQKNPPWVLALVAPTPALLKLSGQEIQQRAVLADMEQLARAKGLQPHEVPLRVRFVPDKFTVDNGLRNANFKLLWTKVEEKFTKLIVDAYKKPLTQEEAKTLAEAAH